MNEIINLGNGQFVKVTMLKGERGSNIASIAKTSTDGLVDTYTITLTDGHTTTFQVTNGANIGVANLGYVQTNNVAQKAFAVGEHLVLNDQYCVVTAPIAQGDTIAIDTNVIQDTVGNEITLLSNYVTPEMFGAMGDGISDDSNAFESAIKSKMPILADKKYKISHIDIDNDIYILGKGTIVIDTNTDGSNKYVFYSNSNINIYIEGITFDGNYTGSYINPWDETQIKTDSECIFVFQNAENICFKNITIQNVYINPAYLSDFVANRNNVKGLALAKLIQCNQVDIQRLNILHGTGEALEIDRCNNVYINGGILDSRRTSYLSVISCNETLIENLFIYGTNGNSININSSNSKMTNCYLLKAEDDKPSTVDVSNEYDNRDYSELIGTTISNVSINNNMFFDSYVVNASSVITAAHPDNYNQVNNVYISNNDFILSLTGVFRFTGYRKFGEITISENRIYGIMDFSDTHKLINNLYSISGNLKFINNIVEIKSSNVTPTDNNGVIFLQDCNIELLVKGNIINFPCVINLLNSSGVSDIKDVIICDNKVNAYYLAYILSGDNNITMENNDIDCSLATVDGGSKVGCGLFVDSMTPKSVKVSNNKFKGFNLFSFSSSTFNILEFFKNIMHINTTRANSGLRLLNITANSIRLISNIFYTNQQAAVGINAGVTCTIDMYYNAVIGGNYFVDGNAAIWNHAGNIANNWSGSVATDNTRTLK